MFIDSHCHLSFPELSGRLDEVLTAMEIAQVEAAIVICTTMAEVDAVRALAERDARLWCSAGVHPDTPPDDPQELAAGGEPDVQRLVALAASPKVRAIGETGLDYFRLNGRSVADMAWQRERFRVHIRAARQTHLPLVIHTRSASDDTLAILKEEQGDEAGGVFHCFTETREVARAALDLGFHISFSGILTFKKADDLREVARMVPLDRCLIETDSPYLAPVPHRGKTNEPALVPHVAAELARIKGLSLEAVAQATSDNARRLFALT